MDLRQQLVNDGEVGKFARVSLCKELVTSILGILLDFDPEYFNPKIRRLMEDPKRFYKEVIRPWLERHPTFAKAEVLDTGRGAHVILYFDRPVELRSEAERVRWGNNIKVVQSLLPTDPKCPGITALTRPLGSINSKTDRKVSRLKKGESVTEAEVLELVAQAQQAPFRTAANLLFGTDRVSPCPFCQTKDSSLGVCSHSGRCYKCGKIELGSLLGRI